MKLDGLNRNICLSKTARLPLSLSLSFYSFYADIDECEDKNGGCPHECVNTQGSYLCHCRDGFVTQRNGTVCKPREYTKNDTFAFWQQRSCSHRQITTLFHPATIKFVNISPFHWPRRKDSLVKCGLRSWCVSTVAYNFLILKMFDEPSMEYQNYARFFHFKLAVCT